MDRQPGHTAGLLFSQMQPPSELEAEFHDWYNTEHIPARMALHGFDCAVRYEAEQGQPRYLACYFLSDMAELSSAAYAQLKSNPGPRTARMLGAVHGFTRYICDQISDTGPAVTEPSVLSVVAFNVPQADEPAFEAWYGQEHVGLLMKADGWLRVRRYRVRPGFDGPAWTHLALHELAGTDALDSPERAAARDTVRRAELAGRDWFSQSGRWLYRPIHTDSAT